MYEGRTATEPGRVLGHENLGEVVEVGAGVATVKVGDRVMAAYSAVIKGAGKVMIVDRHLDRLKLAE